MSLELLTVKRAQLPDREKHLKRLLLGNTLELVIYPMAPNLLS